MKNLLTKFLVLSGAGLLMLSACKKSDPITKSNGGQAGALNSSFTELVLNKSKLTDTTKVVSFTFTQPDFGYNAAVTNTLQIDSLGDNWVKPTSVTIAAKKGVQAYSTSDFNALLLKMNLVGGVTSKIQVRIQHSVGTGAPAVYSNVLTLTVTPFNLKAYLYVPGAYQGWSPSTADSLLSATSNGIYVGIIHFTTGNLDFKITPAKVWDHSYGLTGTSSLKLDGGGNITAPGAGITWVTVDINANTITFAPVTAYYSLIGDATAGGWGSDTDMKYDNGNQVWAATVPLLSTGQFKVRKNHDWGTSYGVPKTGATEGALNNNDNNNITVPSSGTYKVTFVVNAGNPVLATYTLTKQ
jgi:hypothetical protein